jgi:carbamoyltransferase
MTKEKPTIGIYGIQDVTNAAFPVISHNHSLVIFERGKIVRFLELERITRKKYDNNLHKYLPNILREAHLLLPNIDYDLIFADNITDRNFISGDGSLRFHAPISEDLLSYPEQGKTYWAGMKKDAYF